MSETDQAKLELTQCEQEISQVKALLRGLGPGGEMDEGNRLSVVWIGTKGLPETAKPRLKLQLSSPIEEAELTKHFDPLDASSDDATPSSHHFRGVETGQATLTVAVVDEDIPIGTSKSHDLAPVTRIDAMEPLDSYITNVEVGIHADAETAEKEDRPEPICTVSLRLTYIPSKKDRREELYEVLNKTTQRKATAIEKLRKAAVATSRAQMVSSGGSQMTSRSPAVKSGFLNKKPTKEPSKLYQLYDKYFGKQSLLRRVGPIAKNYIIFFGFCIAMHFKGQLLSLPPPV